MTDIHIGTHMDAPCPGIEHNGFMYSALLHKLTWLARLTGANMLSAGKTSGNVPADQGVIQGTLSNSVDSFMLCA